jgi:hypothetical protein
VHAAIKPSHLLGGQHGQESEEGKESKEDSQKEKEVTVRRSLLAG